MSSTVTWSRLICWWTRTVWWSCVTMGWWGVFWQKIKGGQFWHKGWPRDGIGRRRCCWGPGPIRCLRMCGALAVSFMRYLLRDRYFLAVQPSTKSNAYANSLATLLNMKSSRSTPNPPLQCFNKSNSSLPTNPLIKTSKNSYPNSRTSFPGWSPSTHQSASLLTRFFHMTVWKCFTNSKKYRMQ